MVKMPHRYTGRGPDAGVAAQVFVLRPRAASLMTADPEVFTTERYLREMCEAAEARDAAASADGRATGRTVRPMDPASKPAVPAPAE